MLTKMHGILLIKKTKFDKVVKIFNLNFNLVGHFYLKNYNHQSFGLNDYIPKSFGKIKTKNKDFQYFFKLFYLLIMDNYVYYGFDLFW